MAKGDKKAPTKKEIAEAEVKRQEQVKRLVQVAKVYEDYLEPRIVLLYRRMVELVATSQLPLVQINMSLDLVKRDLMDLSHDAYSKRGTEKLMMGKDLEKRLNG